jgi:hypothetical protein
LPETEQDVVLARLLRRLWRRPSTPHPFRPLRLMVTYWAEETRAARARWVDAGLVQAGLRRSLDAKHGLDDQAVAAVRRWAFRPGTRDGAPVPVWVTIDMDFSLR